MSKTAERAQVRTLSTGLSPTQAAKRTGVSRWTIMRALKSQELYGDRDNRNHWRISPEKVDEWASSRAAQDTHNVPAQDAAHPTAQVEIATLQKEVERLQERLALTERHSQERLTDREEELRRLREERKIIAEKHDRLEARLLDLATPWWRRLLRF